MKPIALAAIAAAIPFPFRGPVMVYIRGRGIHFPSFFMRFDDYIVTMQIVDLLNDEFQCDVKFSIGQLRQWLAEAEAAFNDQEEDEHEQTQPRPPARPTRRTR